MIEVIQGEKQPFTISLRSKSTGDAFDLTGFNEITVCFKAGSTTIEKTESAGEVSVVGADDKGKIQVDLKVADTTSFAKTTDGQIEVSVDFGSGDIRKLQILDAFHVVEKICAV